MVINEAEEKMGSERFGKNRRILRKPEWLKIKLNTNDSYKGLRK